MRIDPANLARYPAADLTIDHIGDLAELEISTPAGPAGAVSRPR